jgi:hypothetical protein
MHASVQRGAKEKLGPEAGGDPHLFSCEWQPRARLAVYISSTLSDVSTLTVKSDHLKIPLCVCVLCGGPLETRTPDPLIKSCGV